MNSPRFSHRWPSLLAALCLAVAMPACAAENTPNDADTAWQTLREAATLPAPPREWQTERPSQDLIDAFMRQRGEAAEKAAMLAADFLKKHPESPRADDARRMETDFTRMAVQMGRTNLAEKADALMAARLKDPSVSDDEKFTASLNAAVPQLREAAGEDQEKFLLSALDKVRELKTQFPKAEEADGILLSIASNLSDDKALEIAKSLANSSNERVKAQAATMIKKAEAVGKPLDIKFTATNGKEIDLSKMKGQVVLVDFWATWCGPCIAELPSVKAAYAKLHPKGFEILGISFDEDKDALEQLVKKENMTWPQYFDGEGWQNKFGQEFGINAIPAMWLVDKKGILRDTNARQDLEAKVEKLLAE